MRSGGASPDDSTAHSSPATKASPGGCRNDRRLSYLRHAQSSHMHPDLLLLVHRRCSSSSPNPYHRGCEVGRKFSLAQFHPVHAHARPASLGQGAPDPCQLQLEWVFPNDVQLLCSAPISHVNQCPETRDRVSGHPQIHAEDSTVR